MNKCIISGYISRDPEFKRTNSGKDKCTFSVGVKRNYTNADGEYDSDFITCVAWEHSARHINKYFHKGSGIEIAGALRNESWEKDGTKHYRTVIYVETVDFGKGGSNKTSDNNNTPPAPQNPLGKDEETELPF